MGIIRPLKAFDSSNIISKKRLVRHMKAKIMKTTDQPKSGNTKFATSRPMKEAKAVPMKSSE